MGKYDNVLEGHDAELLYDVARCSVFGNLVITIIGEAEDAPTMEAGIMENGCFLNASKANRVNLIQSAIAELEALLDEIKNSVEPEQTLH